jgi:hypothetical protein
MAGEVESRGIECMSSKIEKGGQTTTRKKEEYGGVE